jgi:hypothetical protein
VQIARCLACRTILTREISVQMCVGQEHERRRGWVKPAAVTADAEKQQRPAEHHPVKDRITGRTTLVQKGAVSERKKEFRQRLVRTADLKHDNKGLLKVGALASRLDVHEEKRSMRAQNKANHATNKVERRKKEGEIVDELKGTTTISTFLSTGRSSCDDTMSYSSYSTDSSITVSTVKSAVSRKSHKSVAMGGVPKTTANQSSSDVLASFATKYHEDLAEKERKREQARELARRRAAHHHHHASHHHLMNGGS